MSKWYFENSASKTCIVYEEDDITIPFDSVALGMIKNNSIRGIVPISQSQVNEIRYIKYDITSKISLTQYLMKNVTTEKLIDIFMNMCLSISELGRYLISDRLLIIDSDFIYVDVGTNEVYMILNPVTDDEPIDYKAFVESIIFGINRDENNIDINRMLAAVDCGKSFTMKGFYNKLSQLKSCKPEQKASPKLVKESNEIKSFGSHNRSFDAAKESVSKPGLSSGTAGSVEAERKRSEITHDDASYVQPALVKEEKKSGILSKLFNKDNSSKSDKKSQQKKRSGIGGSLSGFAVPGEDDGVVDQAVKNDERISASKEVKPVRTVYVENRPMPAVPSDDSYSPTVAIMDKEESRNLYPTLQNVKTSEIVTVEKSRFVIGRQEDFVDYCIKGNPSVGRSHAYIEKIKGIYYIFDMNSKNNTYINGDIVRPGEAGQLNSGDVIRIADEELIFEL